MTESAFGVDHGDVSKAFAMPKIPGSVSNAGKTIGGGFRALGNKAGDATTKAGFKLGASGLNRGAFGGTVGSKIGTGQMKLGLGMMNAGNKMKANPGLTGGALAGGAAAGGVGAFGMNRKRQ